MRPRWGAKQNKGLDDIFILAFFFGLRLNQIKYDLGFIFSLQSGGMRVFMQAHANTEPPVLHPSICCRHMTQVELLLQEKTEICTRLSRDQNGPGTYSG
jgi:hypothetical protein